MTPISYTSAGIAYDRAGPRGDLPVVLIHAGVADRRMWDPVWRALTAEVTPDLRAFIEAERSALVRGDLDGAVEANLTWWVDGPRRDAGDVDSAVRDLVRQMQRRAFEVTADWDDIQESELDPPALERLADIRVPTLALLGALDLDAIHDAARRVADGIPDVRRVDWPDTAHLPSMERPDDFLALLRDWLIPSEPTSHH